MTVISGLVLLALRRSEGPEASFLNQQFNHKPEFIRVIAIASHDPVHNDGIRGLQKPLEHKLLLIGEGPEVMIKYAAKQQVKFLDPPAAAPLQPIDDWLGHR